MCVCLQLNTLDAEDPVIRFSRLFLRHFKGASIESGGDIAGNAHINTDPVKAELKHQIDVPLGADLLRDTQFSCNIVAFPDHVRAGTDGFEVTLFPGRVIAFRHPAVVLTSEHMPVIGVKVDNHAARCKQTKPLLIDFFRCRNRLGHVSGHDKIKGFIGERHLLGIHLQKLDGRVMQKLRILFRLLYHIV